MRLRVGLVALAVVTACADGGGRSVGVAPARGVAATCAPPTAAVRAELERAIGAASAASAGDAPAIRPICREQAGWLVEVAATPPRLWLVPAHGDATPLDDAWSAGPVDDFDGDGRTEATTIAEGGEIVVWFDAGTRASYVIGRDDPASPARAGTRLAPGRVYLDGARADREPPPRRAPAYSCTADDGDAAAIAHALSRGFAPAPCARPRAADRAAGEAALATTVIAARGLDGVLGIAFSWGCTSHGVTPVVVDYDGLHDRTGAELWLVDAGGAATRLDAVGSPAPDEWSSHDGIALGPSGDFDGDGAAESIIVHSHHAAAHGTSFTYAVWLGDALRPLPSDLVARAVSGPRDGVVRTGGFGSPHVTTPCPEDVEPDSRLDCELQPPAGYVRVDACGPWDWATHAPQLVALAGARAVAFTPLPDRAVAAFVAATAADRAGLR